MGFRFFKLLIPGLSSSAGWYADLTSICLCDIDPLGYPQACAIWHIEHRTPLHTTLTFRSSISSSSTVLLLKLATELILDTLLFHTSFCSLAWLIFNLQNICGSISLHPYCFQMIVSSQSEELPVDSVTAKPMFRKSSLSLHGSLNDLPVSA